MPRGQVKRACDACHRRKLKCDGGEPCTRCLRLGAHCTFLNPVRPKGPAPRAHSAKPPSCPSSAPGNVVESLISGGIRTVAADNSLTLMPAASITDPSWDLWQSSLAAADNNAPIDAIDINDLISLSAFDDTDMFGCAGQLMQWQMGSAPPVEQAPPLPMSMAEPDDICPILILTLDTLVKPQIQVFFDRIYSMIPVYTREEVNSRISQPGALQDRAFVALILSMVSLSLVHPLTPNEVQSRTTRVKQATMLLDEACKLTARWDLGSIESGGATLEGCLTSYLMFGALFEMGHQTASKLRLSEAVSLGEAMGLHRQSSYISLSAVEAKRRMRMYWILAVTERAYALQRSGNLVFRGSINTNMAHAQITYPGKDITDSLPVVGEPSHSLRHLATVFSCIDQDVVRCWNADQAEDPDAVLPSSKAARILADLQTKCPANADLVGELDEKQRADLLITWQWIRSRIWRLAMRQHIAQGYMPQAIEHDVLRPDHVLDIAQRTVDLCRVMSFEAMEAHGTGFVEKLYDIANLLAAILRSLPIPSSVIGLQVLQNLSYHVSRHRKGTRDYAGELNTTVQSSVRALVGA